MEEMFKFMISFSFDKPVKKIKSDGSYVLSADKKSITNEVTVDQLVKETDAMKVTVKL